MSLELLNTLFSAATFTVIAATAIAAIIQLRHLRAGNQLSTLLTIMEMWETPAMQTHIGYMRTTLQDRLKEPGFLKQYGAGGISRAEHQELLVADFWEQTGTFVKYDLIDERALLDISSAQILSAWRDLEPIVMTSRVAGGPAVFENFEYLAVRAHMWHSSHPNGAYPANVPRMAQLRRDQRPPAAGS